VAGLFVIIGVCLPGERHITESIETNRKMTIVYDTVSSLRRFKDWNPLVLRDPAVELKLSGPASGTGATLDFTSKDLGTGSWKITEAEENKRVVIAIEDATKGHDKVTTFNLEPTGKGGRNVKITQDYSVKYGFDLFGRYAGLYVSRQIGDDIKRAGDYEPWHGPRGSDIRIMRDIYPPRITLQYTLKDASGRIVDEGEAKLSDTGYLHNLGLKSDSDPLRYEKRLIDDWVKRELSTRATAAR